MASGKKPKDKDKKSEPAPIAPEVVSAPVPDPVAPSSEPVSSLSPRPRTLEEMGLNPYPTSDRPAKVHYDETDVEAALARTTQDGKGEQEPQPSNWVGYADPNAVREAGT